MALLTARIEGLKEHMESHRKDKFAMRRLTFFTHRRRKMLKYLRRKNYQRYAEIIEEFGIGF